jgi:hypothetical protein
LSFCVIRRIRPLDYGESHRDYFVRLPRALQVEVIDFFGRDNWTDTGHHSVPADIAA